MKTEDQLITLGLQKNEASVYLALLKSGRTKAQTLIKETGLHRMLVYKALDDLVSRGFATVSYENHARVFRAEDPTALTDHTKKLGELANALVPKLQALQGATEEAIHVRTLTGLDGFRSNLEDLIESASQQKNREICIIGGARDMDFYDATADWYPAYTDLLKRKKVKKRLLAPASYSSEFKKRFASEKNTELRTLTEGLSSPSYTRITGDMVALELYKPELTVIQIKSPTLAQAYLDSFNLLWNVSEEY